MRGGGNIGGILAKSQVGKKIKIYGGKELKKEKKKKGIKVE